MKMSFSKTNYFLLLLLTLVITEGCLSLVFHPEKKTYFKNNQLDFFDKAEGGVDKLINIGGYYAVKSPNVTQKSFIFFNDGSFSILYWKEEPPIFMGVPNINLNEHLQKYRYRRTILGYLLQGLLNNIYGLEGGVYVFKNDTIITEHMDVDWLDTERHIFKVKDRNSIVLLSEEFFYDINEGSRTVSYDDVPESHRTYYFVPAQDLPSSIDMYNKNLRYRWSDRRSWKNHKAQRREYKNNKRKNK